MRHKIRDLKVKDRFLSVKNHPCGSNEWVILRKGADFKVECVKCKRVVLLDASKMKKIIKEVIS